MSSTRSTSSMVNSISLGKKPKRPLTPYNLFYRFKRGRILNVCSNGNGDEEIVRKLVAAVPGLEDMSPTQLRALHPQDAFAISRDIIRQELHDNLLPFEGKRSHRRTHGMMDFVEMGKMMCDQWKAVDAPIKSIFQELAEEGKRLYHQRLSEYKVAVATQEQSPNDREPDDSIGFVDEKSTKAKTPEPLAWELVNHSVIGDEDEAGTDIVSTVQWSPSSPRSRRYQKVNIVTPVASKQSVTFDFDNIPGVDLGSLDDDQTVDDFRNFIDEHIHPVANDVNDLLWMQEEASLDSIDLIALDKYIDH